MNIVEGSKGEWEGTGPLYHGTDLLALVSILKGNNLTPSIDATHTDNDGVSFTTDARIGWGFALRSSDIFEENHNHRDLDLGNMPKTGALITIDSMKLRQTNRLVDYVDHLTYDDDDDAGRAAEAEVRCLGSISNLAACLTAFSFHPADVEWFLRFLATDYAAEDWNVEFVREALAEMLKHPLFKAV